MQQPGCSLQYPQSRLCATSAAERIFGDNIHHTFALDQDGSLFHDGKADALGKASVSFVFLPTNACIMAEGVFRKLRQIDSYRYRFSIV